jgi:hypothetical protein
MVTRRKTSLVSNMLLSRPLGVAAAMVASVLAGPGIALAQQAPAQQQAVPVAPPMDEMQLAKLIWGTMAAVDQANQTGNYSVLKDLGAPGFQTNNDSAKLAQVFAGLRSSGVDLSNTLLLAPTYRSQPRLVQPNMMQVQGMFTLRPTGVNFEFLYQWVGGKWRLFGVGISPAAMAGGAQPQQPAPQAPPKKK